jgi:hypothetical protein
MTYKKKPEKKNTYPELLNTFEKKRTRDWIISKANQPKMPAANKIQNVKMIQRFSGKRGN